MSARMRAMLFLFVLSACGDDAAAPDGGASGRDSGPRRDGGDRPADGGAIPDGGARPDAGPRTVLPCDAIDRAAGWEHITPPEVSLDPEFETPAGMNFGAHSVVIDPTNTATVYVGTSAQGIFKSTDCGATFVHVNTGRMGELLDEGRQWTFIVDPVDSNILYANAGYGSNNAYKSVNGGVDWDLFIDPDYARALQFGGFVHYITMDPTNHLHLIVTPHFACEPGAADGLPVTANCLLETMDGGDTWRILEGTPSAGEGAGQWMVDSMTWYWAVGFEGLFRTGDGGASWQHVYGGGYATPGAFRTSEGALFTGGVFSVLRSENGIDWTSIPDSPGSEFMAGDADTIFGARNGFLSSAPASDPTSWTPMPMPDFPRPDYIVTWDLVYDPDHRVLYTVHSLNGVWRYALP